MRLDRLVRPLADAAAHPRRAGAWGRSPVLIARNPRFFMPFPDGRSLTAWGDPFRGTPSWPSSPGRTPSASRDYDAFVERAASQVMDQFILRNPPSFAEFAAGFGTPRTRTSSRSDPRLGGRDGRVLLRDRADAGRRLRARADRHLPRPARRRHRLRQALPLHGHGDRQARGLGLRTRRDGRGDPGAERVARDRGVDDPHRRRGRPDLRRGRPGHRRGDDRRRGDPRPHRALQRRPEAHLPEAGRPDGELPAEYARGHRGHPDHFAGDEDQSGASTNCREYRALPAGAATARADRRRHHRAEHRLPAARLRGRPPRPAQPTGPSSASTRSRRSTAPVAPEGKHTISIFTQFFPYELAEGTWDERRDEIADHALPASPSSRRTCPTR